MKLSSSMHERFNVLTAPRTMETPTRHEDWYDAEALQILVRTSDLAKSDEFRLKEHDLGALFGRMSVLECRALHKRLANPTPTDALACAFSRLVSDRKLRLLTFLADVRRREAVRQSA